MINFELKLEELLLKGVWTAMASANSLAEKLRSLDPNVFPVGERDSLKRMLSDDVRLRCDAANQSDAQAWAQVKSKEDWEKFGAPRIEALRKSLGNFPAEPAEMQTQVTLPIAGAGYNIENLVYESRAGLFVTANLYLPSPLRENMPGIIIVHSHHNPKTQGELQDMGMTWARQGCMVLVMDQLSYGERRQHQSGSRQDYRFRYINGIQLHLIGDSLMGWMVWDVRRGVDVLLSREGIDEDKIILIGAVAGGGDPAAVAAAIDPRITCAIPFNFGGPQPETTYPLPDDAETTFNYMGYGSWESTRNLRLSARAGFLPWVIVAVAGVAPFSADFAEKGLTSEAPRRLIYAHEFSWDRERDPVWKRLQRVFEFYGTPTHLDFACGAGVLSGRPPESTHCNNVGAVHRKMIYPLLHRWFDMQVPEPEYQQRRQEEELMCLTPEVKAKIEQPPLHELFGEIGAARAERMRVALAKLPPDEQRRHLRQKWAQLLGDIEPKSIPAVKLHETEQNCDISIERIVLEVEPNIVVPMLLLLPKRKHDMKPPVVVALSQEGKVKFMSENAAEIADLLMTGFSVCLPDVRGTGETSPGAYRGRQSEATSISSAELMLGQTLLGSRLRDVRSVLLYLRARCEVEATRIALWGDSFATVNEAKFIDPLIGEGEEPSQSAPLGGLLALFGALYEDNVCAVVARGIFAGYQSILRDRFCYIPHDVVVPGALTAGDLCDVAAALIPLPLRLERLVDGRNCIIAEQDIEQIFKPTRQAYSAVEDKLLLTSEAREGITRWLVESFK